MKKSVLAFEMSKKTSDKAEIRIYNHVGKDFWNPEKEVTGATFAKQLDELGDVKEIDLRINSPGGSVMEGNAIYNLLIQHPAKITTYVDGMAASIASIIAMAGSEIKMPENSLMMIHNPSVMSAGTAKDLRKSADVLDQMKVGAVLTYTKRTGLPKAKIEKMMDEETWMTAKEAVDLGFADVITDSLDAVASAEMAAVDFDQFGYKKPPSWSGARNEVPEEEPIVIKEETPMADTNVVMTEESFKKYLEQALANKAVTPNADADNKLEDAVNKVHSDGLKRSLADLVKNSKLTPAQSKMFSQLGELVKNSEVTFSMEDDGSKEAKGNAYDLILAVASTVSSHGLLKEQVPGNDSQPSQAPNMTFQSVPASEESLAQGFKLSRNDVPDHSSKEPERYFMDAYTRNVVMKANPSMSYADAAVLTEKSATFQNALKAFMK